MAKTMFIGRIKDESMKDRDCCMRWVDCGGALAQYTVMRWHQEGELEPTSQSVGPARRSKRFITTVDHRSPRCKRPKQHMSVGQHVRGRRTADTLGLGVALDELIHGAGRIRGSQRWKWRAGGGRNRIVRVWSHRYRAKVGGARRMLAKLDGQPGHR